MTKSKYIKVTLSLPDSLFGVFKNYCQTQGMKPSSRIAVLIEKDLEKQKDNEHS